MFSVGGGLPNTSNSMPASSTREATTTDCRQALFTAPLVVVTGPLRPEVWCARGHCQFSAGYWMDFSVVPISNFSRWTLEVISFCGTSIGVLP